MSDSGYIYTLSLCRGSSADIRYVTMRDLGLDQNIDLNWAKIAKYDSQHQRDENEMKIFVHKLIFNLLKYFKQKLKMNF